MRVFAGTSGFSYKEWRGAFYPEKLSPKEMLEYYSARLPAVEINNTFYRMPGESLIAGLKQRTPEHFRFVLKAPRSITHSRKLADSEERTHHFAEVASGLGEKLGPLLFQLPPTFQKNVSRLESFLACLPGTVRAAFEFRHPSWQDAETRRCLERAGAALCIADVDGDAPELVATAPFTYLRLRREDYDDAAIARWAGAVAKLDVDEAYVFFKHERRAPELAMAFLTPGR